MRKLVGRFHFFGSVMAIAGALLALGLVLVQVQAWFFAK
jgi:hypothetical protein